MPNWFDDEERDTRNDPELHGYTVESQPALESEASEPDALSEMPRSATESWARKWLHLCRAYGIDPTADYPDVVAQFDHAGELQEQVGEFFGIRSGTDRCFTLADGRCISPFECLHGDPVTFKEFMHELFDAGLLHSIISEGLYRA